MIARVLALFALAFALALAALPAGAQREGAPPARSAHDDALGDIDVAHLPPEARETVHLIRKGGPFPYARDGVAFRNRENQLPRERRGYYREFTVKTPGERTRGARRIIAGKGGELYYTEDHYAHFRRIRE
jgi:ribonuclease T1